MPSRFCFVGLVLLGVATGSSLASGAAIVVFNTGTDGVGDLLPPGSADPHYTIFSSTSPNFPGPSAFVEFNLPGGYPTGPSSQWIGPQGDNNIDGDNGQGTYDYRTTFDLTGLVSSTRKSPDNGRPTTTVWTF